MRGLMAAVIGMGVLIVVGATTLVLLLIMRVSSAPPSNASAAAATPAASTLAEPSGTRIAGVSLAGDHMAVQLAGGGPDRLVVLDTRTGRVVARVALER